jgi:hypothetical protein
MTNTIQIQIKNVYGEEKAYPVCKSAVLFAKIAGTKTLTRSALTDILYMGFSVQVVDRYGNVSKTFGPLDAGYSSCLPMVA